MREKTSVEVGLFFFLEILYTSFLNCSEVRYYSHLVFCTVEKSFTGLLHPVLEEVKLKVLIFERRHYV